MTRILFINTTISWNKGSAAQVASTCAAINERIPAARFSMISYCTNLDKAFQDHSGVSVVGYDDDLDNTLGHSLRMYTLRLVVALMFALISRLTWMLHISNPMLVREKFCRTILESDVVIDLSGDSLSDRGSHSAVNVAGMLLCITLRKPVVCYSQSIGPFSTFMRPFAKFVLSRVKTITVRERTSYDYLVRIGTDPAKIRIFGDCAFELSTAGEARVDEILKQSGIKIDESRTVVGISISALMAELHNRRRSHLLLGDNPYLDTIQRIIETILEADDWASVLLVPHVIAPRRWALDDRWACEQIVERLAQCNSIFVLSSDYTAQELKGVIRRCDFFIGSRMHACIAALSQCIPTVALSWSHKYAGIMERLGMSDYVLDTNIQSPDDIASRVKMAFLSRESISGRLKAKAEAERISAREGVSVILRAIEVVQERPLATRGAVSPD